MRLSIFGTGYVGAVTAAGFASLGQEVLAYDISQEKIETLRRGIAPFYEPGLNELLSEGIRKGTLHFTDRVEEAVAFGDLLFVCVGTPSFPDGRADLSQVEAVSRSIAHHFDGEKIIVEKSTVPVKTAQWIRRIVELYNRKGRFSVASNPEFLREGSAVQDFLHPDRIVIGVEDDRSCEILLKLYEGFSCPKIVVDLETAEIIKHASNSFLAMKISFINMVANLCEAVGADVEKVALGMGLDPRIGRDFLRAGIGYGGSCFPKDLRAFARIGEELGVSVGLLREVERINEERIPRVVNRLKEVLWILRDKTVALLGLAFKPNTDDVREAPSLRLARALYEEGARLRVWDPHALDNFLKSASGIPVQPCRSPEEAVQGAHAAVIVCEWEELKKAPWERMRTLMETPVLYDGRNLLNPQEMVELGYLYCGVGKGKGWQGKGPFSRKAEY
jgi:UDPglucose 6-dehydrogenase